MTGFGMSLAILLFMITVQGVCESANIMMPCDLDAQCPEGYFCYEESQYCSPCVVCSVYKRKPSWRLCPKTPSDCGSCLAEHEEEILHGGKTREMCVSATTPTSLNYTVAAPADFTERYFWAAVVITILLPVVFYAFFKGRWKNNRSRILGQGLQHEDPPPYRSIELSTLSNNSEEQLAADHEVHVGQLKDNLVQAVPFRVPDYAADPQFPGVDNTEEDSQDETVGPHPQSEASAELDLNDEETIPSQWTPGNTENSEQLMMFDPAEVATSSDSEPATKKRKQPESGSDEESFTGFNINLFINNNVVIHKP